MHQPCKWVREKQGKQITKCNQNKAKLWRLLGPKAQSRPPLSLPPIGGFPAHRLKESRLPSIFCPIKGLGLLLMEYIEWEGNQAPQKVGWFQGWKGLDLFPWNSLAFQGPYDLGCQPCLRPFNWLGDGICPLLKAPCTPECWGTYSRTCSFAHLGEDNYKHQLGAAEGSPINPLRFGPWQAYINNHLRFMLKKPIRSI